MLNGLPSCALCGVAANVTKISSSLTLYGDEHALLKPWANQNAQRWECEIQAPTWYSINKGQGRQKQIVLVRTHKPKKNPERLRFMDNITADPRTRADWCTGQKRMEEKDHKNGPFLHRNNDWVMMIDNQMNVVWINWMSFCKECKAFKAILPPLPWSPDFCQLWSILWVDFLNSKIGLLV